jgi:thioredoxin reductase (NADPH)
LRGGHVLDQGAFSVFADQCQSKLIRLALQYASHVYVVVRRDVLRASKVMAKRLLAHPKVTVLWNSEPIEAKGDGDLLTSITLRDTKSGETRDLPVNGLFYAIGEC